MELLDPFVTPGTSFISTGSLPSGEAMRRLVTETYAVSRLPSYRPSEIPEP